MKKMEVFYMDYEEFDKLVHDNFPERADYCFIEAEDADNDSCYVCTGVGIPLRYKEGTPPEKIKEFADLELEGIEKWLQNKKYSGVGRYQILEALYRKGVIEAGNYLIRVSW